MNVEAALTTYSELKPLRGLFFHPNPHTLIIWTSFQNYNCGGFPCDSADKISACNVGDLGLIPGLGRFPGEGKGYLLQYLAWRIPWTLESIGSQVRHD